MRLSLQNNPKIIMFIENEKKVYSTLKILEPVEMEKNWYRKNTKWCLPAYERDFNDPCSMLILSQCTFIVLFLVLIGIVVGFLSFDVSVNWKTRRIDIKQSAAELIQSNRPKWIQMKIWKVLIIFFPFWKPGNTTTNFKMIEKSSKFVFILIFKLCCPYFCYPRSKCTASTSF